MKISSSNTYVELGLVISIVGAIAFITNDHAKINTAQADIIRIKDSFKDLRDIVSATREDTADIRATVRAIKEDQDRRK